MPPNSQDILRELYSRLFDYYGSQKWWPGETPFEVMVGAILTQNTNWKNVTRAIENLKSENALNFSTMHNMSDARLAQLIRPAGYYNVKTKRLKAFLMFLHREFDGDLTAMGQVPAMKLREQLLGVKGIGKETADSILLYALHHPIFVVDAYTFRVLSRHFLIPEESDYDSIQEFITDHVTLSEAYFNEYHALLVGVGKDFCKPKPRCELCPLNGLHW